MKINFDSAGGRKYLLGVGCLIAEIALLCTNFISALIFKELFLITLGITAGTNVAEKIWAKKVGDKK
jgi:hypothetical protein